MNPPRYIVITPARDEEGNIGHTIRSMVGQTRPPALWVIVNDGSTDQTANIIDVAAQEHSWILPVHRADRRFRQPGGGVVEAFYDGYCRIPAEPWDFLVKLDADLSFDTDYFERCLQKFADDPKLGIGGGLICQQVDGNLVCESPGDPSFHVRGATKIYRHDCWAEIGGLLRAPGWDTIDELTANMLGWTTRTFKDVPLKHHRYTGSADGTWKNYVKFGLANYITGYHPLFMALKCLKRCGHKPYLVGAVGLWWGFCRGYLKRVTRVDDAELIRYVRRQQFNKIVFKPSLW
ncbi:MAG: glycosyltransferase [Pseudomonadota bacterium]|nr:glycosyltransferase [Pseudomonadota bacterium]